MSERLPGQTSPFSVTSVGLMLGIGILAFTAIFALLAWAPELASKDRAGDHPYSTSALGYAGLIDLLEADGQDVSISRVASTLEYNDGLLVITIPRTGFRRLSDLDPRDVPQPTLFVLPKWNGRPNLSKPSWQDDTFTMSTRPVQNVLRKFDSDAEIFRLRNPGPIETDFGRFNPKFEHKMQVFSSDSLESIVETPGGTLLGKLPGAEIYVLSDPDVMNTFGLARRENALFTLNLIEWLKFDDNRSVVFDATIHGFQRSENLLRAIFDAPFLGATLLAFATIFLIGWAAMIRFTPPIPDLQSVNFGKTALAESSAGLIEMSGREKPLTRPYKIALQRALVRDLGLPANIPQDELDKVLDSIAKQRELPANWTETTAPLQGIARTRDDLRTKAATLWRWRKEMKDGHH